MSARDAARLGGLAGTPEGSSFRSAKRRYCSASVAATWSVKNPGHVVRVEAVGSDSGGQPGQLLADAGRVLNRSSGVPLDGGHRFGDLQPLRGGIDQLGQRVVGIGWRHRGGK